LLCFFLFSSPWCFLVIKRKCVFHFSHYYYLFLSSSYDYPQNMSCFFLFSLFLCCCFLFFLSYHCSTATMVSFRSPPVFAYGSNPWYPSVYPQILRIHGCPSLSHVVFHRCWSCLIHNHVHPGFIGLFNW
jgi:hypothetical protein